MARSGVRAPSSTCARSFDVDGGEDEGVPEDKVRLDEVLVHVGDVFHYGYGYGDDWEHRIKLEAVSEWPAEAPPAMCVDGRRAGPPEDCGGIHGYEEMLANAADPASDEHDDAVDSMVHYLGSVDFDANHLDLDEVNSARAIVLDPAVRAAYHSRQLSDLLYAVQGRQSGTELLEVIRDARLDLPVEVEQDAAASMVQRFTWFLHRIGDEGIKLTAAGYLPPVHVLAAVDQLGMHEEWVGKGNREDMTLPVLELREATQHLGLVRKYRGRLLHTKQGQRLRNDPVALWWHIAAKLPLHKPGSSELQAGLVALGLIAAGRQVTAVETRVLIAQLLNDLGWRLSAGAAITEWSAYSAARDTTSLLEHLQVFGRGQGHVRHHEPSAGGRTLAEAVLRG